MISITVHGEPTPQARHRHTSIGKFVRTYDPSSKDKKEFLKKAIDLYPPKELFEGSLIVTLLFVFSRPKSHYGTGRNKDILKGSAPKWHTTRKDIDNLQKFVFDAFNGHYYVDDCQIVSVSANKIYVDRLYDKPLTEITIEEL